jgi:hypothetical protein
MTHINKKGNSTYWILIFLTLLLGFYISYKIENKIVSMLIILLFGITFKQILTTIQKSYKIQLYLISFGFLVGFIFGSKKLGAITLTLIFILGLSTRLTLNAINQIMRPLPNLIHKKHPFQSV